MTDDDITSLTIRSLLMTIKSQREIIETHLKDKEKWSKHGSSCTRIQCEPDTVLPHSE